MAEPKKLAKQLDAYYATLGEFEKQYVLHEGATSIAFQALLGDVARGHHWTLIPQLTAKGIRPDATLKDPMGLVRGHWEAKDTKDDLDVEIANKIRKKYPLANIIFEDTRTAVLYQNKQPVLRADLSDRKQLAALLDAFFGYVEPQIERFEDAVNEFKERVPDIAKHLKAKIEEAHVGADGPPRVGPNKRFNEAFAAFMDVCRNALNPTITQEAVDDMLVQHLLTERLIREIFDNPEFTRRNVIAAEIEKVIAALTSKSFDRNVFLKHLDRFYVAIENAARTITEWSDKQHFLNTVYERFFQGYSVKLADTMGIVYTPQPIVDFMCASVVEVLQKEFGKSLGDKDVHILDPCTGTGNFIVNLLRRVPKKDLPRVYREQLFANEIMLLPYYIAALNIEHAYYEQTGEYEPFEGLCFVDTLDLAESRQAEMSFMTAKNTERVERQKHNPITVIVGNPPYNMGQKDENENNKNREYEVIDERIYATYAIDSNATLKTKLYDAYVKFFRWSVDRLGDRDGIICYVTNNSFVDQVAFDGMRQHLLADFNLIYHVDLHGNVRKNPKLSGTTHNVFGIQVGVGITVAVKRTSKLLPQMHYFRLPEFWRKEAKLSWLSKTRAIHGVEWQTPAPGEWINATDSADSASVIPLVGKGEDHGIFGMSAPGINTARDRVVYDYEAASLVQRIKKVAAAYNAELDRYKRVVPPPEIDTFVEYGSVKWSAGLKQQLKRHAQAVVDVSLARKAIYRPFDRQNLYFSPLFIDRPSVFRKILPIAESTNAILCVPGIGGTKDFHSLLAADLPDFHFTGDTQAFPFYVYDEDGNHRRENITDWALDQFRTHYGDDSIGKWDIFHYVYGLLHHGGYRTKFADNLKRELPRVPFAPEFRAFATAGAALARLHLEYESLEPWPLAWVETLGVPLSYHVERMKLSKDKGTLTVNASLTLGGIPPEVARYRLGNRSALEWVVDQYQVSVDKRSGIRSDPNREDDEQYIVRLVGQVVRVSVETVRIVETLPAALAVGVPTEPAGIDGVDG